MLSTTSYGLPNRTGPSITVPGDLLSTNIGEFRQQATAHCAQLARGATFTIDLRAARLVDSVGLNALVTIIKAAKARDGEVLLRVAHPSVRRILSFTRIDTHAQVTGPDES